MSKTLRPPLTPQEIAEKTRERAARLEQERLKGAGAAQAEFPPLGSYHEDLGVSHSKPTPVRESTGSQPSDARSSA